MARPRVLTGLPTRRHLATARGPGAADSPSLWVRADRDLKAVRASEERRRRTGFTGRMPGEGEAAGRPMTRGPSPLLANPLLRPWAEGAPCC